MTGRHFGFAAMPWFGPPHGVAPTNFPGTFPRAVPAYGTPPHPALARGSPPGSVQPGPAGGPGGGRRTAEAFLRDVAATTVRKLFRYVEAAAPRHPEVATCYPALHQAARAFQGHDYARALSDGYQV